MTWREDLVTVDFGGTQLVGASFRDAVFFVESSERGGGRRAVVHELPFRDDPFVEDLGRKAATFRVEGYVLGDQYLQFRDKLREKLEDTSGPGKLVHPYYGSMQAICTELSISESKSEGGWAKFSIQFTRTGALAQPAAIVDSPGQISTSSDTAKTASSAELVEKFKTTGLPSFAFASAEIALTNAIASLRSGLSPVISATQELAQFTGALEVMTLEAETLVRTPATLLDNFHTAITALAVTARAVPGDIMNALIGAYAADLGAPVVATTTTRADELVNQIALQNALRRVLAIEAARLAPVVPYVTIDDALAARATIASMLDEQAALADDTAYPAIVDLRSQVLRAVPGDGAFASVVAITRKEPLPSIVLAYQLYGDTALELDLVARNDVPHPGFVAGDLKVLIDG